MDVTAVLAAARRVLAASPYGFLTTSGPTGPSVRMVEHLSVDENLQVVFGTERGTRKEREIAANPEVVYAVADPATRAAVCLYGEATAAPRSPPTRQPAGPDPPERTRERGRPARLVHGESSVDEDRLPSDVGRRAAGQEHRRAGEVLGQSVAPDHRARGQRSDLVRVG